MLSAGHYVTLSGAKSGLIGRSGFMHGMDAITSAKSKHSVNEWVGRAT